MIGFFSEPRLTDDPGRRRDVAGETVLAAAASCRMYPSERGLCGVLPVEAVAGAIAHQAAPSSSRRARFTADRMNSARFLNGL